MNNVLTSFTSRSYHKLRQSMEQSIPTQTAAKYNVEVTVARKTGKPAPKNLESIKERVLETGAGLWWKDASQVSKINVKSIEFDEPQEKNTAGIFVRATPVN